MKIGKLLKEDETKKLEKVYNRIKHKSTKLWESEVKMFIRILMSFTNNKQDFDKIIKIAKTGLSEQKIGVFEKYLK